MTDSERLPVSIYSEIERYKQERPFDDVVVYMTYECFALLAQDIIATANARGEIICCDKFCGCRVRRMVADGIRFAVGYENVFERSNENAE